MQKVISAILCLYFLAGCSTTYQKSGATGGYSDIQLSEDMFKVTFKGNGYTSSEKASDFCLLRCANLAIENGFSYFIIIDQSDYQKQSTHTTPIRSQSKSTVDMFGNVKTKTTTSGGKTYLITKPRSANVILCFKEKPEDIQVVYDAVLIAQSIRQRYGIWRQ